MKTSQISLIMVLCVVFSIFLVQTGFSQEASALDVVDPAICQSVENRACVDPKTEFSADVERLYCLTRITGAAEDTEVTHVWYYGNIERARIPLAVRSISYRTYSSKKIQAHEIGDWHVDVLDSAGSLIKSVPFKIVQ